MGKKFYEAIAPGLRYRTYENGSGAYEIRFPFKGMRCSELLALPRTSSNDLHIKALRGRIISEIALGIFNYGNIFPESKRALRHGHVHSKQTVKDLLTKYLTDVKVSKEAPTYRVYSKPCINTWIPQLGTMRLCDLDGNPGPIKEVLRERAKTVTLKTLRNDVTPFRTALDLAVDDNKIEQNPFTRIKLSTLVRVRRKSTYKVDPYDLEEIKAILDTCAEIHPAWLPYWQFIFFTGLRTSEGYAMRWSNIDLFKGRAFIDSAIVEGSEKVVKTEAGERTLELLPAAIEALKSQRVFSKPDSDEFVFKDPRTGDPITCYDTTANVLRKLCLRSGVRFRMQRQTRHSFASNLLSGGDNPWWVASQMGHTTVEMIFKIYGRWIALGKAEGPAHVSEFAASTRSGIRVVEKSGTPVGPQRKGS